MIITLNDNYTAEELLPILRYFRMPGTKDFETLINFKQVYHVNEVTKRYRKK
jgi:hypothetical protein